MWPNPPETEVQISLCNIVHDDWLNFATCVMKMGGTNKENIGSGVEVTAAGVDVKQLFFP